MDDVSASLKRMAKRRAAWERTKQENADRQAARAVVRKKELALKELKEEWVRCLESNISNVQKKIPYFFVPNWYIKGVSTVLSKIPSQVWIDKIRYLHKSKRMGERRALANIYAAITFNRILKFFFLMIPLRVRQSMMTFGFSTTIYEPKPGSLGIRIKHWFSVIGEKEIEIGKLK